MGPLNDLSREELKIKLAVDQLEYISRKGLMILAPQKAPCTRKIYKTFAQRELEAAARVMRNRHTSKHKQVTPGELKHAKAVLERDVLGL